ncbi:hypothetical protein PT300_12335 [Enterobacteriaceae bacterium ESL0689]|nr:hypothetical protein [Enterobacteriaceae bacterium ESL0689]
MVSSPVDIKNLTHQAIFLAIQVAGRVMAIIDGLPDEIEYSH